VSESVDFCLDCFLRLSGKRRVLDNIDIVNM